MCVCVCVCEMEERVWMWVPHREDEENVKGGEGSGISQGD